MLVPALVGGCRTATNYPDPAGPRFVAPVPRPEKSRGWPDTLLIVSFNVKHGRRVERALEALAGSDPVQHPDLVLLQEMEEDGVRRMADVLDMGYVYYPAILNHRTGRHFGNAVLTRWPVVADEKLVLPRLSAFGSSQRIATVVTIQVGPRRVRVYSVHLGTPVNLALQDRREQMRTVLHDAASHPLVVLGGDLNSGAIAEMAADRGYAWPTRDGPRTFFFGRWDHILFKGLHPPDDGSAGTIMDNREASDHRPVWARAVVR